MASRGLDPRFSHEEEVRARARAMVFREIHGDSARSYREDSYVPPCREARLRSEIMRQVVECNARDVTRRLNLSYDLA